MARIKIKDLPLDLNVSEEELRKITGGLQINRVAYVSTCNCTKCNCTTSMSRLILPTLQGSRRFSPLIKTGF